MTAAIRSQHQATNINPHFTELPPCQVRVANTDDTVLSQPTADSLLKTLAKRSARFDRSPSNSAGSAASLLNQATDAIADAVLDGLVESTVVSGVLARAALLSAGLSAGAAWYEGLKLGIEKINEAHRKAQAFGARAHMARGLSQTLAIGAKNPELSLTEVRHRAIAQARKLYLAQAAADRLHRQGKQLKKDTHKRDERFEGLRRGIELALALLSPLSSDQRQRLGQLAQREGKGSIDEGFRQLARPAVGADNIHARRR